MKLALIRPNLGDYRASDAMPPLALGILAARSPGWDIAFYDEKTEPVPAELDADLVALSVETYTAASAYRLADGYRVQGLPVVMGGYHPTLLPDEALQHADAIVTGDAEGAWERLLRDFTGGRLAARIYAGDAARPLADVRVERDLFGSRRYAPIELIQFGRGCRYACDFCSIHSFYGRQLRQRPLAAVRAELERLDRRQLVFFVDDNLYASREQLLALLAMLQPLGLRWSCQISVDVARDEDLLDRMAAAGCAFVLIGFESLEPANLKQMGKAWNKVAGPYTQVVRRLHARGIGIYGTFVFGYDHDTAAGIERCVDFAIDARLDIANFNPLTPTPGSALYARLRAEDRLLAPLWWRDPQWRYGDPIFEPRSMAADELAEKVLEARCRFYAWRSIALRLFDNDAGLAWFRTGVAALANAISRREIANKQRRRLGV